MRYSFDPNGYQCCSTTQEQAAISLSAVLREYYEAGIAVDIKYAPKYSFPPHFLPMKFQRCQLCAMLGILTPKSCIVRSVDGQTYEDQTKTLAVCPTCYDTPAGVISENVKHRRLPDAEYNQKP